MKQEAHILQDRMSCTPADGSRWRGNGATLGMHDDIGMLDCEYRKHAVNTVLGYGRELHAYGLLCTPLTETAGSDPLPTCRYGRHTPK